MAALEFSEAYRAQSQLSHGVAILQDVARKEGTKLVEEAKAAAMEKARSCEAESRLLIRSYDRYFAQFGYICPLGGQLDRTLEKGLPTINRFVDTLLACEMATGILMGAQDYGQMEGPLVFDLAVPGETYEGMRAMCECRQGEIVVRDSLGIVASYFQGSDKRTAITRQTSDVVFFGFTAPGVPAEKVDSALKQALDILAPASRSTLLLSPLDPPG